MGGSELKEKAIRYRKESIASSTKRNRIIQWNCYLSVCKKFKWSPVPCSVDQACMYVSFLADKMKLSSITTYYQAVVFAHTCQGLEPVTLANPILKATLKGIGNMEGNTEVGKDPLFPKDLIAMSKIVNKSCEVEMLVFTAILFLFRTLLRVSHVVDSKHAAISSDIKYNSRGFLLRVRSAKNLKAGEKKMYIPVLESPDSRICPVHWLRELFVTYEKGPGELLFSTKGVPVLTYSTFSRHFRWLVSRAGLQGNFASHSLRRGGASYMSMKGCNVSEVKERGGWRSECVYRYICPPLKHKIAVDRKFVRN